MASATVTPVHRREVLLVLAGGFLLAMAMFWPLPLHLTRDLPRDLGDPLLQAWQPAWGGHALLHQPLHLFQSNTFWPLEDSFAFSDALIGYAPAGLVGEGLEAAIARYNLLFLFSFAMCFAGAYLLARELGVPWWAAIVAGAAFAYSPWRLQQMGHLHVAASGGIPFCLFLLLHGYRRHRPGVVVLGWCVATWQVLLGPSLGLHLIYLLAVLGAVAAVAWIVRRRPALDRRLIKATAVGGLVFVLGVGWLALPYLDVRESYLESRRGVVETTFYSPPPRAFLSAPELSLVWGARTAERRATLSAPIEQTLFPGLLVCVLALAGVLAGAYPRTLRLGLALGIVVAAVLSMGFAFAGGAFYKPLYELAPGWNGPRTPGRLHGLTTLGLALLAAAGAFAIGRLLASRWAPLSAAIGILAMGVVLLEGSAFRFGVEGQGAISGSPHPKVPKLARAQVGLPGPQLHLPFRNGNEGLYMLWSTEGFPEIVNGISGFEPTYFLELAAKVGTFPDRASVAELRRLGVRTVVLHPELAAGTSWQGAESRGVAGLDIRRTAADGVVVYDLR